MRLVVARAVRKGVCVGCQASELAVITAFCPMSHTSHSTKVHLRVRPSPFALRPSPSPSPHPHPHLTLSFSFESDPDHHVCEVQLVHAGMLTARKHCNAHAAYSKFRSALEMLETFGFMDPEAEQKTVFDETQDEFDSELVSDYENFLITYREEAGLPRLQPKSASGEIYQQPASEAKSNASASGAIYQEPASEAKSNATKHDGDSVLILQQVQNLRQKLEQKDAEMRVQLQQKDEEVRMQLQQKDKEMRIFLQRKDEEMRMLQMQLKSQGDRHEQDMMLLRRKLLLIREANHTLHKKLSRRSTSSRA